MHQDLQRLVRDLNDALESRLAHMKAFEKKDFTFGRFFTHPRQLRLAAEQAQPFVDPARDVYLDIDTVALCDTARLGAVFDAFEGAACFGFAGEDPSGGKWPTW